MLIRLGTESDWPALRLIYNEEVLSGCATFDMHPKTEAEWADWGRAHSSARHPLLVAEADGRPIGYATLSPFRAHEAYASTVELSVYVHRDDRGQGIGSALIRAILAYARAQEGIHCVVSVITDVNEGSMRLHTALGFRHAGTLREAGFKMGRWHAVEFYDLIVGD